ncbi:MAG: recombinase family protein [Oscillospiraceae bacterium]|nr:recombinase family protein [Oscillospiraceae bacterium]MCL2279528.1 recombinase family protein [Oscillospiraceae bacterium]
MSEIIYKAAKYIRKSYTDDKNNESESVANQRRQLDSFIENQKDIEAVSEWVDDGVSGILFDRPAFKQMMADIEQGEINCIVVKDISRFGREYIETGRYLRRILPAYGVRFIAINDNIDTLRDNGDDLIVSVKTLLNDAYCRDISVKIRSALHAKRESGEYVGACPVYGYKKDENNHNRLVIDEYPAGIVRDIYRMKIDGLSALKIAETLNNIGVLSPLEYKKDRGLPHPKGGYADKDGSKWSPNTVIRILHDETYAGTLVQGRQSTFNYKIKDIIDKPASQWQRIEDAHNGIISTSDFELVQRIMRLDTRTAPGGDAVHLLSGILICGSCGGRMTRKTVPHKGIKYKYYYCPTTKKRGCKDAVTLREDELHGHITECVKAQIANIASVDAMLAGSDAQYAANAIAQEYLAQIDENKRQLNQILHFKNGLYEKLVEGIITQKDYKSLKAKYTDDEVLLNAAITTLLSRHDDALSGKSERLRWIKHFKSFADIAELDRRMVISLIQSIRVIGKYELQITFNYQAEFEKACAVAKEVA